RALALLRSENRGGVPSTGSVALEVQSVAVHGEANADERGPEAEEMKPDARLLRTQPGLAAVGDRQVGDLDPAQAERGDASDADPRAHRAADQRRHPRREPLPSCWRRREPRREQDDYHNEDQRADRDHRQAQKQTADGTHRQNSGPSEKLTCTSESP